MYAARQYVRANIRSSVRTSSTKCTVMYCEHTAGSRRVNLCTYIHVDKVRSSANFNSLAKVLDLDVQGQTFKLSTLVSSYTKYARVSVGTADYFNRQDVRGVRPAYPIIFAPVLLVDMVDYTHRQNVNQCQPSRFLGEMQCVVFSPIAYSSV